MRAQQSDVGKAIERPDRAQARADHGLVLAAGIAGLLGALAWIAGDILIVGHVADPAAFPALFTTHGDRIERELVERLVGVPIGWLRAGALVAAFAIPLYLAGVWQLWQGMRGAPRALAVAAAVLMFVGFAIAPLPHAAFYFVGAVYQALPGSDPAAHATLLDLADEFHRTLSFAYFPAVICQVLGMLAFALAVASGRSAYPRRFALVANPLTLGLLSIGLPRLIGGPIGDALTAAAFNVAWFVLFALSIAVVGCNTRGTDAGVRATA